MTSANKMTESPGAMSPSETSLRTTKEGDRPTSTSKVDFVEPEVSSPEQSKKKGRTNSETAEPEKSSRHHRVSLGGKRLSGRPSLERLGLANKSSLASNPSISSLLTEDPDMAKDPHKHRTAYERLSKQVNAWLAQEKTRRAARKAKKADKHPPQDTAIPEHGTTDQAGTERRPSEASDSSVALESLANILERTMSLKSVESSPRKRRPSHSHKLSSIMKRHSAVTVGSDTDYFEGAEELVPSCEAVLDNSKTMAYSGGAAESNDDVSSSKASKRAQREKEAWATFKYEILRITHTLKLKGWKRIPLDQSNEIEVERLSGALTNAVYVVSPPKEIQSQKESKSSTPAPKNPPPKLLLRIYGPQVEHLIDREAELQILRRLARKRIGPRLLGTFNNGRFEEFFHAQTLTFQDLRVPETSKQIAKRMRELHEGIELLRSEREGGPFVWKNWDKWVERCEQVISWLDKQNLENMNTSARGLICGVEWPLFRQVIEKYRKWLEDRYGGPQSINQRLVFAHNDAQYGNILRLIPAGESPLLLPANEHKQLVVIDFEYANANLPGLEFANHFTEWCYNYHSEVPHACSTKYYPTAEEQSRFIRAYLTHNPTLKTPSSSASIHGHMSNPPTPKLNPLPSSGSTTALAATAAPSSISAFMLDSRAPPGEKYSYQEEEKQHEQKAAAEVERLMAETRLWRLANSAQWTAWGIVQAQIPGLPDFDKDDSQEDGEKNKENEARKSGDVLESATLEMRTEAAAENEKEKKAGNDHKFEEGESEVAAAEDEEFDYLAYAQERAMFVWGDAIQLGLLKIEELPEELRKKIKVVEY